MARHNLCTKPFQVRHDLKAAPCKPLICVWIVQPESPSVPLQLITSEDGTPYKVDSEWHPATFHHDQTSLHSSSDISRASYNGTPPTTAFAQQCC